jgi:hypothetical protein
LLLHRCGKGLRPNVNITHLPWLLLLLFMLLLFMLLLLMLLLLLLFLLPPGRAQALA